MFRRFFPTPARRPDAAATGYAAAEVLEGRRLLTGRVTAELIETGGGSGGQTLRVIGSGGDDAVVVTLRQNGTATVRGRGGTTVNGAGRETFDLNGGGLLVSLRGGDDAVLIRAAGTRVGNRAELESVSVTGDGGSDRTVIRGLRTAFLSVSEARGNGDDRVKIADSVFEGSVDVLGGAGDDVLRVDRVTARHRNRPVELGGGGGDDLIRVRDARFAGRLTLLGDGPALGVTTDRPGDDRVVVQRVAGLENGDAGVGDRGLPTRARLRVDLGGGEDRGRVLDSAFFSVDLDAGAGNDGALLSNVRLSRPDAPARYPGGVDGAAEGRATLRAGAGDDLIRAVAAFEDGPNPAALAVDPGPADGFDRLKVRGDFGTDPDEFARFDEVI